MPHILYTLDFTPTEPPEIKKWSLMIRKLYEQLARIVNGLISFGDGVTRDNIDGEWASVTTPATPDTDFTITHNLMRLPVGYIVMGQSVAGIIYNGDIPPTTTQITLKCNVASDTILIFIV